MKQLLDFGSHLDVLTHHELAAELDAVSQRFFQEFGRGIKYLRFGPAPTTIANNAFKLDGSSGQNTVGPREGFLWSVTRITVWGLTSGTTPDVANLYRNAPVGIPVWQFNGNTPAVTFSKLQMVLLPGEYLSLTNSGSTTATGQITIAGDAIEVAAEELSKIA